MQDSLLLFLTGLLNQRKEEEEREERERERSRVLDGASCRRAPPSVNESPQSPSPSEPFESARLSLNSLSVQMPPFVLSIQTVATPPYSLSLTWWRRTPWVSFGDRSSLRFEQNVEQTMKLFTIDSPS
jgi:hypothetical protein